MSIGPLVYRGFLMILKDRVVSSDDDLEILIARSRPEDARRYGNYTVRFSAGKNIGWIESLQSVVQHMDLNIKAYQAQMDNRHRGSTRELLDITVRRRDWVLQVAGDLVP